MRKRFLFSLVFALFISPCSFAASSPSGSSGKSGASSFYIGANVNPIISQFNDSVHTFGGSFSGEGSVSSSNKFGYNTMFTMGPTFWDHLLIGFSYNYMAYETHRPSSAGGDTTKNEHFIQKEWGPTIGLLAGHWEFKLTWLISSQKLDSDSEASSSSTVNSVTKNYDGHGWEFSGSYGFQIFEHFTLGPSLVYRRVRYGLQTYTDNVTPGNSYAGKGFADKADDGTLDAMLALTLKF